MSVPTGIYPARVVAVVGENPGLRTQHAYTLDISLPPSGNKSSSVLRVAGVANVWGCWWNEQEMDTKAAAPNSRCLASFTATGDGAGIWEAYIRDGPDYGDC